MSNLGFIKFMERQGIHTEKTAVGDRYVLENMRENGYAIGGEQSGLSFCCTTPPPATAS